MTPPSIPKHRNFAIKYQVKRPGPERQPGPGRCVARYFWVACDETQCPNVVYFARKAVVPVELSSARQVFAAEIVACCWACVAACALAETHLPNAFAGPEVVCSERHEEAAATSADVW